MPKDPVSLALRFLKFRPRSVFEIEQKLKSKKISDGEIKKVIAVLKENKLLDDTEFAKMWVRDRNLLKPTGTFLLKLELKKLGLPDDDIAAAISNQDEESLAREALAKLNRRLSRPVATKLRPREMKYRDREIEYEKKVGFLQRRGFGTSIIYKILRIEGGK